MTKPETTMHYDKDSDSRPPLPGAGQLDDYTDAFLVVAGVLVFITLFVIWASAGMPVAVMLAYLADRVLLRF